jgi:hypothetical protein
LKPHFFAIASRDEIWVRGSMIQQRLEHGHAHFDHGEIQASDRLDAPTREACDALVHEHSHFANELDDCRVRIVASARRVGDEVREEVSVSISLGGLSVVTTPEHVGESVRLLRNVAPASAGGPPAKAGATSLPLVWRNGSAAILIHEAAGHAAEHGAPPVPWPDWLTIRDVPRSSSDDAGETPSLANLIRGECPSSLRRASFRDAPLRRMSEVVVEQHGAPFDEPEERIDVLLVEGGSYDPLTEMVSLRIAAADLIRKGGSEPMAPFDIIRSRSAIAAAMAGASGAPIRYPGVVCSREGQEVFVGSQAPVMLTLFHE